MPQNSHISAQAVEGAPDGVERRRHPRVSTDPAAEQNPQTGPYGVDRRIDPRLKFEAAAAEVSQPAPEDRRAHPRIKLETSNSENERRERKRRHMEAMRAQLQRTMPQEQEQGFFDKLRARLPSRVALKPARLALIMVAVLTGGLAAYLASGLDQQATPPAVVQARLTPQVELMREARTQILVADTTIGVGQRLSPTTVSWQEWPEGSVRSDYITQAAVPDALTEMSSSVARFEIFPGEPIRQQKLVTAEQGYLSAVLGPGQRGVSVLVSAETASGGFIVPNDRVDVVMSPTDEPGQFSRTILENVQVLAINTRLGERGTTGDALDPDDPRAEIFTEQAIATLALTSAQAEIIISATMSAELSLVLRSMADFSKSEKNQPSGTDQAIRLTSPFWTGVGEEPRLQ
ncbi:MAG TPA: Flp pilus assembly protein CpaB [Devosia sp.]|nr:Flp pilus assembly protein CpaB [Devosia sp.]